MSLNAAVTILMKSGAHELVSVGELLSLVLIGPSNPTTLNTKSFLKSLIHQPNTTVISSIGIPHRVKWIEIRYERASKVQILT